MRTADQSCTSEDDDHAAMPAMLHRMNKSSEDDSLNFSAVQLANFRAACQQRTVAHKVRESEARARALAVGNATEELKREQRKRRKAVQRAKQCEEELGEAQKLIKELQYINGKLQQQLASTQAAAEIAAERSNSSLRNLRESLCALETDASHKFAQGQQQVQRLINFSKDLQSYVISSSNSSSFSPRSKQLLTSTPGISSNSKATQAISGIFQALAALGELLVPTAAVLLDTEDTLSGSTAIRAAHSPAVQQPLALQTTALSSKSARCTDSSRDASCLAAQLAVQQARLEDVSTEKAKLQQQCNSLQLQCDEMQQQLRRQAGNCAELSHDSQVTSVQHLAEVAGLQAEKLHIQQEVEVLQQSLTSARSALQLLRDQHEQQTSRLANANAETLQLKSQVSKLEAQLVQQQQDAASTLCIVAGRDAHTADASLPAGERSPRRNLLACLARPCSAAAAAAAAGQLSPQSTGIKGLCSAGQRQYTDVEQMGALMPQTQQREPDYHRELYGRNGDAAQGWIAAAPEHAPAATGQLHDQHHLLAGRSQEGGWLRSTTDLRPAAGRREALSPVAGAPAVESCAAAVQLHRHQIANCSISPGATVATASPLRGSQQQQQLRQQMHRMNIGPWNRPLAPSPVGQSQCAAAGAAASATGRPHSSSGRNVSGLTSELAAAALSRVGTTGGAAACRISQDMQQRQQPLTAAERHRALVADADAALARLAACRKAAVAGAPATQATAGGSPPGSAVQPSRRVCSHESDAVGRIRAGGAAADAEYALRLSRPALLGSSSCVAHNVDRTAIGRMDSPVAKAVGVTSLGLASSGVRNGDGSPGAHMHSAENGICSVSQPNGNRLQALKAELNALDHDFAYAEAQLQAATARLGGYPAAD